MRRSEKATRVRFARPTMALVGLVTLGVALQPAPVGGQTEPAEDDTAADRVLLVSMPGLTWADVAEHDLPVLESFLEGAAVANHAPRAVTASARPGAAYLTISAGTRVGGHSSVDGQQLDLEDRSAGSAAGEIFQRRTGVEAEEGYVSLAWPSLLRRNADQPYDAELGLLNETLADAGLGASVIANADGVDTVADSYERQAGLATVTPDGVVPSGDLDVDLLVTEIGRPFGRRLDTNRVAERFAEAWQAPGGEDGGLVVVEASDLARTLRYRNRVDEARYDELWAESLAEADELLGDLLEQVDPVRDSVLLLAPYNLPGDRDLTVAALDAQDGRAEDAGYMRSASTQRSGFVTLVDVAPTLLKLLDVERPAAMEGRPFEVVGSGAPLDERIETMVSANDASRFREHLLVPTSLVIVVALAVVGALTIVLLARPRASDGFLRSALSGAALFTLALMPMTYVARAFPLEERGLGFYWAFVLAAALVVGGGATVAGRLLGRPRLALAAVLTVTAAVPAWDVMTGSNLSLSATFGYSPTGNSRLYGLSNYTLGMFGASMSLLAGLVASRRGRWSQAGAVALMVAALAVIGVPVWGANVGGILSFSPVVVLFMAMLLGSRLRLRVLLAGFAVAMAAAVGLFAALDLARPSEQRAHLGRLVERIADDGLGPLFSVMERKALGAAEVTFTSFWTAAVLVAVVVWLSLRRLPTRPLPAVHERVPLINAGFAAAVVAAAFGSIMNDSGSIVGGTALLVVVVALVCLVLEPVPASQLATSPGGDAEEVEEPAPGSGEDAEQAEEPASEPGEGPVREAEQLSSSPG